MRLLLTGGAGFIGSHTCLSLLEKGYEVIVVDSFINSSKKSLERVLEIIRKKNRNHESKLYIEEVDLRDLIALNNVFLNFYNSGKNIDVVIHFAGLKSVSESISKPLNYWDVNVHGTINLLKTMDKFDCNSIVFSSSATIYDPVNSNTIDENNKISPINPYGHTKYSIERMLTDVFNSSNKDWRVFNLRYFNPIGAHYSGLIGENPIGIPNNIYPLITKVAAGKIKQIEIFGSDWDTKDGTGVRDYIHVMDLAEGHVKASEKLLTSKPEVMNINLGTGVGTSVLKLINTFQDVNKVKIPFVFGERREGDYGKVVANNSLALKVLDWKPYRTLEDMCIDGWKWQELNPNGY